jgi:hypothetical protein
MLQLVEKSKKCQAVKCIGIFIVLYVHSEHTQNTKMHMLSMYVAHCAYAQHTLIKVSVNKDKHEQTFSHRKLFIQASILGTLGTL